MDSTKFLKPKDDVSWKEDRQDVDEVTGTTFIYNRFINLELEEQRRRLPIYKYRLHILYLLEKYQTLVLVGDTGSGKSTQVCQYLYEAGWCSDDMKIGITEPRRFCVTTLAQRVADERCCPLGSVVGYSIRFDDCQDEKLTKIKYMTEGILIREMMADPLLRQYCVIILDEVHERNILTDILMGLLKKILRKRKRLKLIVTSATVDAVSLRDFFNFKKLPSEEDTSVILGAEGKLHSIQIHYAIEPIPDYVDGVVDCVCKIHKDEPEGDILAFLTGSEEVDRAVSLLRQHLNENINKYFTPLILPMYGTLPNNDQLKVFRPAPRGMRKIVISTNIAETSVTISGIVYVVDCGFVKLKWFNPKTYTDSLVVVPISKASAEQRAGRAGRTKPGKVYRLYPEEEFEKLENATPPEMSRTDLSQAVLQLKALGISNILRFTFPSPPPAQNLLLALELLYALGAIDDNGELTNPLGVTMAEFPLPPLHAKTLISAGDFGCTDEISSILAMLQVDNVFIKPRFGENSIKAQIEKRKFEVHEGDLITLLNVFTTFEKNLETARKWCQQHFINYKALRRAFEIKYQMLRLLERFNIPKTSCDGNVEKVCYCIASGFFPNAAYLHFSGVYKTVRGGEELYVHPTSVLYSVEQPQWLLYCELIHTSKLYMRDVTVVKSSWLEELAPNFYHTVPTSSAP
ncbi:probable ATP-dependent RNA helicase DHX35 [Planococcus citri]|uniref:probable ATP-dependent RNA helicase DHX35 n=1 Tax=Planococcus citri TaxID=170843 RepID=UPI0031F8D1C5